MRHGATLSPTLTILGSVLISITVNVLQRIHTVVFLKLLVYFNFTFGISIIDFLSLPWFLSFHIKIYNSKIYNFNVAWGKLVVLACSRISGVKNISNLSYIKIQKIPVSDHLKLAIVSLSHPYCNNSYVLYFHIENICFRKNATHIKVGYYNSYAWHNRDKQFVLASNTGTFTGNYTTLSQTLISYVWKPSHETSLCDIKYYSKKAAMFFLYVIYRE